jgi:hypothetical protein
MPTIVIDTDGTIQATKLTVDGKDLTVDRKIVDISLYASAPYKSKYSGENIPGSVGVSYTSADDKGILETVRYGQTDTPYGNIGKIKNEDQVTRFIGHSIDKEIETITNQIIQKSQELKVKVPVKEVLISRSLDSLKDKALDLGIVLTDSGTT